MSSSIRLCMAVLLAGVASPAVAQYPIPNAGARPVEDFKIEFGAFFWKPTPDIRVNSEEFDVPGTTFDLVNDLGVEARGLPELRFVIHPARKHKFRVYYMPITYEATTVVQRTFTFNGTTYTLGIPVATDFEWHTWRFGYEYDFISRPSGYLGVLVEAKYTDLRLGLSALGFLEEASARAPIPAIGGIFRVYPVPFVAITGEISGISLPDSVTDRSDGGDYLDWDISGTVNLTPNVGAQIGYHKVDLNYHFDGDFGKMIVKGVYFGGVVRF